MTEIESRQGFVMKTCVLFLLVVGSVYSAPVDQGGIQPGSCEDPSAVSAAHLALSKINLNRVDGYIFSLHRLSNVHLDRHVSKTQLSSTDEYSWSKI